MIDLARAEEPLGHPIRVTTNWPTSSTPTKAPLAAGGVNWYRNIDRNWHLLAEVDPIVRRTPLS